MHDVQPGFDPAPASPSHRDPAADAPALDTSPPAAAGAISSEPSSLELRGSQPLPSVSPAAASVADDGFQAREGSAQGSFANDADGDDEVRMHITVVL